MAEVGVGSWAVGDGGFGFGKVSDGLIGGVVGRVVDMGAEDWELIEDGEEVVDGVLVVADFFEDGVVPDSEAF